MTLFGVKTMFITDKLIYLQMQKTGCTHIASLLSKHVGGKQHGLHNWLESYDTNKFIVGSVRNPWDWYVSLWAYGCSQRGGFQRRLTSHHSLGTLLKRGLKRKFREVMKEPRKPISLWKSTYEDPDNQENFRKWLKLVYDPRRKTDLGEDYSYSSISSFAGFMTYRYCYLHLRDFFRKRNFAGINDIDELRAFDKTHNLLDGIIRTESLEDDFIRVVQRAGHKLSKATIKAIKDSSKVKTNPSQHRSTSYYFDEETRNLVSQKEEFIIEKYGYKPP